MEWQFHADDACTALSARRAFMRFLRRSCAGQSDFEAAEVVFGELIANAIRHAPGPIDITVHSDAQGVVHLDVLDTGPGFTLAPSLPPCRSESGRGLYIASRLCPHVSATCAARGSTVSVVLPVTAERSGLHLVERVSGDADAGAMQRLEWVEGA